MTTDPQKKKQSLVGVVVSDKMDKTRVVLVTRYEPHPKYQKYVKYQKRYKAHDPENVYKLGDRVVITASRPVSRHKAFVITEKIGVQDITRYLAARENRGR
jgi:small subunit ribosomal protein S17